MKRNLKSLNEEISRMKSLFTEERLYGNLVENEEVITEGELLKVGSKGDGVKGLQELLGVTIDGIFGEETKKSLMNFQSKNGLKADGVAGPKTLEKLMVSVVKPTNESLNLYEDKISALNLVSNSIVGQEVVDDQGKPLPDSDFVKSTSFFMNQNKVDNPNKQPEEIKVDNKGEKVKDKPEEIKVDDKKSEEGGEEKKGTYDDQNKGSEEDKGPSKAGTDMEGDTYSKGERKDVVKGVLASVKQSAGEIDDNIKKCKQGIKQLYIQIKKVSNHWHISLSMINTSVVYHHLEMNPSIIMVILVLITVLFTILSLDESILVILVSQFWSGSVILSATIGPDNAVKHVFLTLSPIFMGTFMLFNGIEKEVIKEKKKISFHKISFIVLIILLLLAIQGLPPVSSISQAANQVALQNAVVNIHNKREIGLSGWTQHKWLLFILFQLGFVGQITDPSPAQTQRHLIAKQAVVMRDARNPLHLVAAFSTPLMDDFKLRTD